MADVAVQVNCETYGGEKPSRITKKAKPEDSKGKGTIKLPGCTVSKPVGCTVSPSIETVKLKGSSEDPLELMRTVFQPLEGSKLASITVSGCAIKGAYALEGNYDLRQ